MLRALWISGLIIAGTMVSSSGCRSCSTCHDYSPPVADCECGCGCGCGRAGSAFGCYDGQCGCQGADGPMLMEGPDEAQDMEQMPATE